MTALENANAVDFDNMIKCGLLKTKLGGKYIPVPVNDPYTAGNPTINSPAILRTWMRAKYQHSPDTYEKRIWPLLLSVADNDATALSFLKNHLTGDFYTWMKIANPSGINAFFTNLKNIWLKRNPVISSQVSFQQLAIAQEIPPILKKDDFKIRLAMDLQYTGIATDDETLEKFIYKDLGRKLGGKTAHARKSPFTHRSTYTMKKVVRKVVQKAKQTRNCSICGKAGHTKVNCPRLKQTKKVNYVYQNEEEDPEDFEEYILEEKDSEEEIEEDDEYINDDDIDDESRNCYALKKSGAKWSTNKKEY
ncbi:hypothetical protein GLOIN_2v1772633 [Rhizophagus clarus]|uniref:CCHC-type domain-containing protein n=1 Tax=Rhizophagus clarus TaxID=94130 RepID=A0A8H3QD19_9GLOM|nr:hypothetical protein GLOIN_2v1772633 [Rhizophagus clarus]